MSLFVHRTNAAADHSEDYDGEDATDDEHEDEDDDDDDGDENDDEVGPV